VVLPCHGDHGQVVAPREWGVSDPVDAIADRDVSQALANKERVISDAGAGDAVRNRYTGNAAGSKRFNSDIGDTTGNCDIRQAGAVIERIISDVGDAVGDRYACEESLGIERTFSDACNGQAGDG
jgi:hypothetical protein